MWAALVNADIDDWHVLVRREGGDVGYPWMGIK